MGAFEATSSCKTWKQNNDQSRSSRNDFPRGAGGGAGHKAQRFNK